MPPVRELVAQVPEFAHRSRLAVHARRLAAITDDSPGRVDVSARKTTTVRYPKRFFTGRTVVLRSVRHLRAGRWRMRPARPAGLRKVGIGQELVEQVHVGPERDGASQGPSRGSDDEESPLQLPGAGIAGGYQGAITKTWQAAVPPTSPRAAGSPVSIMTLSRRNRDIRRSWQGQQWPYQSGIPGPASPESVVPRPVRSTRNPREDFRS